MGSVPDRALKRILALPGWAAVAGLAALLLLFLARIETARWLPAAAPDSVAGLPVGDFSNFWAAGRLARSENFSTLYAAAPFSSWKAQMFGHAVLRNDWVYPASILPLAAALSMPPVALGFCLWNAFSLAAMAGLLRWTGLSWGTIGLTLVSPANLLCLIYGQLGGIVSVLVFAGLVQAARRPLAAGIMIGLVTLKPQTGLLVPVAWLAARHGRAILAAGLTFLLLALLAIALFGPASWSGFFFNALPAAHALVVAPFGQGWQLTGTSVFWMCRSFGASLGWAAAAQFCAAAAAAMLVWRLWRRPGDVRVQASLTAYLALFVAPYGFAADMVGYSLAVTLLARRRGIGVVDGLLWLWPGYAALVTGLAGWLLTPLVVALAAARGWEPGVRR